jgi:hypothetical protein
MKDGKQEEDGEKSRSKPASSAFFMASFLPVFLFKKRRENLLFLRSLRSFAANSAAK